MAQQNYKKFVASAATATLVASALVPMASANVNTSAFTDVAPQYKDAVEFLVSNNIAKGMTETQFGISQQIKRVDAAIMISAAAGLNDESAPSAGFSDVPKRGALAVNSLKAAGVVNGKTTTKFGAEDNITRGEAALMLQRAFDLKSGGTTNEFTDVSDRYDTAVDALVANKVTKGINATQFGTQNNIKRGDFAMFLYALKDQIMPGVAVETVTVTNETTTTVKLKEADKELTAKDFKVLVNGTAVTPTKVESDEKGEVYTITHASLKGTKGIVSVNGVQADFNFGPAVAPEVVGVTAISATKAKVTFKGTVQKDVDFSNFDIDGNLTVTNVEFSADRQSATITVNPEFVRNQEYTLSVFGVLDADGKEYAESKAKFSWEVAEGVVVALGGTTLEQNQTVGLTVKDAGGKDVKDAKVTVTSLNTNLVTATPSGSQSPKDIKVKANNDKLAGTADVLVETELPDGSILNNTFKVTVKEAVTTVTNAGYTLTNVSATGATATPFANTSAFKNYGKAVTSLVEGTGAKQLVAFAETNGNPDVTHLDFTDAKVTSSNAIVATATVSGTDITVTPLKVGSTTLQVVMKDGSRKSFPITVTAEQVITDLSVSDTTVNLSDENRTEALSANGTTGQDGVDAKEIEVETLDQYKNTFGTSAGKVTVTSSTDGLKLFDDAAGSNEYVTGDNELTISSGSDSFYIQAQKDKPVSNAKVTVSYFKNTTDTKPTMTKTITVNVAKINPTAKTSNIDVVAGSEIDANALNITSGTNTISFDKEIYAVDSEGNRLENISYGSTNAATTYANLDADNTEAAKYVDGTGAVVSFDDVNSALSYLRAASTVNVKLEVIENGSGPSAGKVVTKIIPVTYKNSAVVPNKVTVSTSPIAIKMAPGAISYEEIMFGKLDADQLIKDDVTLFDLTKTHTSNYITPLKTAKNAGYKFNKSIVSVLGTDGKAMNTGAALYGNVSTQNSGNIWVTEAIQDMVNKNTKFATGSENFEYEFAIANVSGDVTPGTSNVTLSAGQSSTFTLVLSGVYVDGSLSVEGAGKNVANASTSEKAKHNLLAAPVQLNVSVSAE